MLRRFTPSTVARRRVAVLAIVILVALAAWAAVADLPLPSREKVWGIGIYDGPTPFSLAPAAGAHNPVLTAADVSDVPAAYVADPFVVRSAGEWHLFFEVLNRRTGRGEIGWAASRDLLTWRYGRIILREPFHLSYPYVFESGGVHYLIPESSAARQVRLYRAVRFPTDWQHIATLVSGPPLADPSLVQAAGRWWMFAESGGNQTLNAYFADELTGPWRPHAHNPVVARALDEARPGGRVIEVDGRLIRFAQVDRPVYGHAVRAFAITTLSSEMFEEMPIGLVLRASERGWNAGGMHHVDPVRVASGRWVALVDGFEPTWMLGYRRFSWRQIFGRPPR